MTIAIDNTVFDTALPALAGVLRGPVIPDLVRDEVLAEIFSATAQARPDHPAMVSRGATLTYAEVEATANAIGRGLNARASAPATWSACGWRAASSC